MNNKKRWTEKSLVITLISIFMGFLVGAVILSIAGYNPLQAYGVLFKGVFEKPKYISQTIINSTPLIITGLSVAFAFRTGLFNIGVEGQFIMGGLAAALVGYFVKLPPVIHVIAVMLAAALAAGLWGGIAGYLKAKSGVNEVITTIMLNWIAFYFQNFVLTFKAFKKPESESSYDIQQTASTILLEKWKQTAEGRSWLGNHPILKEIFKTDLNVGIIIAIALIILVWFILRRTTLGYELRAVGSNKYASEYGGVNVKKSIIASMMIAGALAGTAGALHVMGVSHRVSTLAAMEGYGLDGISVALIAGNSPIGCLFAGLLFGGLKYGGSKIQQAMGAPSEIISIMIGTIVFFIAMPTLIRLVMGFISRKRGDENA